MKISVDGWLARDIRRSSDQVDATNQAAVDRDALLQRQNALSHEVRDDRGLPRAQYTRQHQLWNCDLGQDLLHTL